MSKELKAPDKVTQKMTRDVRLRKTSRRAKRPVSAKGRRKKTIQPPQGLAAEKVVQHIGAEIERHAAKGAEKKSP